MASDGWQPIETAPRDGTEILAWFPPNRQAPTGARTIVQWHHGDWYSPFFIAPTMWQPLPAPPKEDGDVR